MTEEQIKSLMSLLVLINNTLLDLKAEIVAQGMAMHDISS